MANVNYNTVIKNAIDGFNDIQNKLNAIGAKDANETAISAASTTTPLSITNMKGSDAFRKANVSIIKITGNGSISGSNCVLSDKNDSGVSVSGSGLIKAKGKVDTKTSGYIGTDTSEVVLNSGAKTQYLTGITLTTGNTFNIAVNGKTWTANYDRSGNLVFT